MNKTHKIATLGTTLVVLLMGLFIAKDWETPQEMPLGVSVSAPSSDGGNLVGYWTLNESDDDGTDQKDKSGNGNDATIAVTPATYTNDQNGVPNQAMDFDGVGDEVSNDVDTLDLTQDFTISANIKIDTLSANSVIFALADASNNPVLRIDSAGHIELRAYGTETLETSATLSTGEYYNIAVTVEDKVCKLYINGVLDSGGGTFGQYFSFGTGFQIGNAEGNYFDGSISDVAIYSSALTSDEVRQLYLAGRTTAKVKVDAKNLVTNGDFATGDFTGWQETVPLTESIVTGNGFSGNAAKGVLTSINGAFNPVWTSNTTLIVGHKYRFTGYYRSNVAFDIRDWGGIILKSFNANTGNAKLFEHTMTWSVENGRYYYGLISKSIGDWFEIGDISVVDITNAITPSIQKGLILDMPLAEPYTEAGNSLYTSDFSADLDNWDDFNTWNSQSTVSETMRLNASASSQYCTRYGDILENGKIYSISYTADNLVGSPMFSTYDGTFHDVGTITSGNNIEIITAIENNGRLYIRSTSNSDEVDISNIEIKELDGTTKDRTPNGNDGTVSGATIKYDGLVNTTAGVAYIPSDTAYGTWEFDTYFKTKDYKYIAFIAENNTSPNSVTNYVLSPDNNFSLRLRRGIATVSSTANDYIAINTNYRFKITRTNNDFKIYIKGGTYGWDSWTDTGLDYTDSSPYTTSSYFTVQLQSDDTISNLKIDGKRHSLADATQSTGTWTTTAPAYDFDGTDDYIDLGADKPTDLTGDITISAWINPESWGEGNAGHILANGKIIFEIYNAQRIYFFSNGTIGALSSDTSLLELNTWQHILVTRTSVGTTNIYIDGVLSGDANQNSGTPSAGTTNTFIGNRDAGDRTFDGQISGLKIYNRVLSESEIEYLYDSTKYKY